MLVNKIYMTTMATMSAMTTMSTMSSMTMCGTNIMCVGGQTKRDAPTDVIYKDCSALPGAF